MIRLEGVSKRFGEQHALRSIDLEVRQGEWLGLFGHNGSGKSTLIRLLLGLTRPTCGRLLLDGRPPDASAWLAFRTHLGFMPERVAFYDHLTGRETLRYFARLRGVGGAEIPPILERVGLADAADRAVQGYSKGMRQRLNLAQALLGDPEVLIVDEPIEGLDPQGVRAFFRLLAAGRATTVVMSSHMLTECCHRVDRICILAEGGVRAQGTVEELSRDLHPPVRVHVYPSESANGSLAATLSGLGAATVVQHQGAWVAEVPQADKVAFLAGLAPLQGAIRHLHVEEPSLEELYFEGESNDRGAGWGLGGGGKDIPSG
ncbi:MAG: ABC transporter ATP-binding protein [Nitrospirota bacterium]|jgi:Cu-processing system ATP-binding protein